MSDYYPRNLNGISDTPEQFLWPDGSRLVINLVLNYEEGSERNILDGDQASEHYLSGFPALPCLVGERHYSSESLFSYGSRSGCWRLLRLFDMFNIPVTVFACGLALERNPAFARALGEGSHEVAGHGHRWIDYRLFTPEDEAADIRKCLTTIFAHTGKKASGWYTGRKSPNTRRLVIEAGLLYDSDDYSGDYPWWLPSNDKKHLVIPYTLVNNDCLYGTSPGWTSPSCFLDHLKATFNSLYHENSQQTRIMSVGLHSRISGHPGRSEAIHQFIQYVQTHQQVSFITREALAREWMKQCPVNHPRAEAVS
ncbi:polysaccharide deacetylase family protein [Endozoicomonas arenosclerae]|uniref:polysaccharide deacetylase family protein n=1 Tax=Endozoicomonas arenosclerae TaxID=1633495 RepID=UPI00078323D1|nr:polysaccharide deacetylase family protein [Endozoicomonas arenosclerae]